jgi:hypothetical protein
MFNTLIVNKKWKEIKSTDINSEHTDLKQNNRSQSTHFLMHRTYGIKSTHLLHHSISFITATALAESKKHRLV